jgi:hypothetical protein
MYSEFKAKMVYKTRVRLTWASEVIPAGRPTGEPITGDNEEVVVKAFMGFRKTIDQFHFYIFGSEMARGCRFRARTSVGIDVQNLFWG